MSARLMSIWAFPFRSVWMNGPTIPLARQARSTEEWVPPIALADPTMLTSSSKLAVPGCLGYRADVLDAVVAVAAEQRDDLLVDRLGVGLLGSGRAAGELVDDEASLLDLSGVGGIKCYGDVNHRTIEALGLLFFKCYVHRCLEP